MQIRGLSTFCKIYVILALRVLIFPVVFIVTFPIEYPIWRVYRTQGYEVWSYPKYIWISNYGTPEQNNYKRKIRRMYERT
jgi:hypothetical protein